MAKIARCEQCGREAALMPIWGGLPDGWVELTEVSERAANARAELCGLGCAAAWARMEEDRRAQAACPACEGFGSVPIETRADGTEVMAECPQCHGVRK